MVAFVWERLLLALFPKNYTKTCTHPTQHSIPSNATLDINEIFCWSEIYCIWIFCIRLGFVSVANVANSCHIENLVMSENRKEIISTFGEDKYHLVYNSLSILSCATIGYGFLRYRKTSSGHLFFNPKSNSAKFAAFSTRALGLIGISQVFPKLQLPFEMVPALSTEPLLTDTKLVNDQGAANSQTLRAKCPIDFQYEKDPSRLGLKRITRHPQLVSLSLLSLSFALATPLTVPFVTFAGFPVVCTILASHQDSRHARNIGGVLDKNISSIPFYALLSGSQQWTDVAKEFKMLNALLGVIAALGILV